MEKYNCVEPFLEENRKLAQNNDHDDKRRLMMKDKLEITRQLNLSKMIKQVSSDLDLYTKKQQLSEVVDEKNGQFAGNSSEEQFLDTAKEEK